jgi:hypothetical protein
MWQNVAVVTTSTQEIWCMFGHLEHQDMAKGTFDGVGGVIKNGIHAGLIKWIEYCYSENIAGATSLDT